jgi:hypothetical protein
MCTSDFNGEEESWVGKTAIYITSLVIWLVKDNTQHFCKVKKVILQHAWTGPRGSRSVKAPDFRDIQHYKGGRSSAICTGHLYPRRNPWYSFSRAESTLAHVVLSGGATEKIPSDTTGNRSRDRPTSSTVP